MERGPNLVLLKMKIFKKLYCMRSFFSKVLAAFAGQLINCQMTTAKDFEKKAHSEQFLKNICFGTDAMFAQL